MLLDGFLQRVDLNRQKENIAKMSFTKKVHKAFRKNDYSYFVLGGDVGGTNTNLGIFGVRENKLAFVLSFHFKSQELRGLHYAVNEVLEYAEKNHRLKITAACFAVAGPVSPSGENAKLTNIELNVSKKTLLKKTKLKKISIINDFEAAGHGIGMLDSKDIAIIKQARKIPKASILVIGAGTGLGKTTMVYDKRSKSYFTMPSEAGHSDFAAQTQAEIELVNFIKMHKKIRQISYEHLLSGHGLCDIYLFLRKSAKFKPTEYTKEVDSSLKPELVSKYRKIDKTCREAFRIFKIIYAKFAKNFALDCLAFGGAYIAGGIAPKNREIFDSEFVKTFQQSDKLGHVLGKIPVYLVLNPNAGLLGAGLKAKSL